MQIGTRLKTSVTDSPETQPNGSKGNNNDFVIDYFFGCCSVGKHDSVKHQESWKRTGIPFMIPETLSPMSNVYGFDSKFVLFFGEEGWGGGLTWIICVIVRHRLEAVKRVLEQTRKSKADQTVEGISKRLFCPIWREALPFFIRVLQIVSSDERNTLVMKGSPFIYIPSTVSSALLFLVCV